MIDSKTNRFEGSKTQADGAPEEPKNDRETAPLKDSSDPGSISQSVDKPTEIGGRAGPDPTRFGDWEKNGRCVDF